MYILAEQCSAAGHVSIRMELHWLLWHLLYIWRRAALAAVSLFHRTKMFPSQNLSRGGGLRGFTPSSITHRYRWDLRTVWASIPDLTFSGRVCGARGGFPRSVLQTRHEDKAKTVPERAGWGDIQTTSMLTNSSVPLKIQWAAAGLFVKPVHMRVPAFHCPTQQMNHFSLSLSRSAPSFLSLFQEAWIKPRLLSHQTLSGERRRKRAEREGRDEGERARQVVGTATASARGLFSAGTQLLGCHRGPAFHQNIPPLFPLFKR